ncbi:MAG: hypothetical protein QJR03_03865 [Sphaerobacter sp.]|nr:hypothetical protein [Sphaerobacter sp.]
MNVEVTTAEQWTQINSGLIWFWAFPSCIVIFAASLLLAHAMIPSLVSTRQLPQKAMSVRPVFYLIALVALVGAIFSLANIVTHLSVLYDLYQKVWI